ncbi:group II intron reverse transcriptase/maturase [Clostridiaceae bacterium M8S5]|nr:group II intron reverse transcriptase/maturase [Clostridiaceae bacterium M8S5]
MQKAKIILKVLNQKSQNDENYKFNRLYRNLYNKDFYLNAYSRIYHKEGNMTKGVDNKTIDGFKLEMIDNLIEKLKNEKYYPKPVRRTYIPKKNGKKRPLGIPSFEDKLLQEVVRQILEVIYEPTFSDNSHGFRPNRSCHTALMQIKKKCSGTNWIIEGDISKCFDTIDHTILLNILSEKIKDGRFIELIRRFLKAGFFEFKKVYNSLSGCPQGSLISPILSNIYLNKFDKFMDKLIKETDKGKKKKASLEYDRLVSKRVYAERRGEYNLANKIRREMRRIPSQDEMDNNFIRVKYLRYCDDFVICVIGSKELAIKIKNKVSDFFIKELKLELNYEKTLITNLRTEKANFLGYKIAKANDNTKITKNTVGIKTRSVNGKIQLLVPTKVINKKIKPFTTNGKPNAFTPRVNLPVEDIINQFNAEMRGLYNYYCLASNVSTKLYKFKYYHYTSLLRTIARKEKSSVRKVIAKYGIDVPRKDGTGTRKVIGFRYQIKSGTKTMTYFNDSIKKTDYAQKNVIETFGINITENSKLIVRINANTCELCGSNNNIEVHHVRKLKDIKNKYSKRGKVIPKWVLTMSKMNRKTLIVCEKCHNKIHSGN